MAEWYAVIKEERATMTFWTWALMARQAIMAILRPVGGPIYRHRLRVCYRCPIFDRGLKRCRPYTGAPVGCGCSIPYKAMAPYPSPCWLKSRHPLQGWG